MIARRNKPTKIETFSDLARYVSEIDLASTNAFIFTDRRGNRYRFVKKETIPRKKQSEYHQMSLVEIIREAEDGVED